MSDHIELMRERVEKLVLAPGDIIIVHDETDMSTFLEMTQQGIGFSPYSNPVLLVRGGLSCASRQDLIEALSMIDQHAAERAKLTDEASRIITDLNAPVLKRIQ